MKKVKIEKTLCFLAILCLVFCDCGSKKITQQEFGNIAGEVYAIGTGSPIPDVLVSCNGAADTTDSTGSYSLLSMPVGTRAVTASKEGYELWKRFVEVRKGSNTLDIYMNLAVSAGREIVFFSRRNGSTQLFAMGSDGSNQQGITPSGLFLAPSGREPLWSPDKQRVAFTGFLGIGGNRFILLINPDGANLDTLMREDAKYAWLGDWSGDGKGIVYSGYPGFWYPPQPSEIFIINSDGTADRELIGGEGPRFCGNDEVIYTKEGNIYTINTDGTGEEQLTDSEISGHKGCDFYIPVASPDGSKIAFGVVLPFDVVHYALGMMNSDGSEDTLLLLEFGRHELKEIEFSPDGQRVLFLPRDVDNREIYVINVDGSGLDSLTGGIACGVGGASWSPDGNWIAFTSNREGNKDIYKVSVDGKTMIQLTDDVADDFRPDW